MIISHIVCIDLDGGIGRDGELLFKIPSDLKNFKEKTTGHHILMGRKTYESIGKVLPNRTTLILSSDDSFSVDGAFVFQDIESALEHAKNSNEKELFVVGGQKVYELTTDIVNKVYLTMVDTKEKDVDTFYPKIDFSSKEWSLDHKTKNITEGEIKHKVYYAEFTKNNIV